MERRKSSRDGARNPRPEGEQQIDGELRLPPAALLAAAGLAQAVMSRNRRTTPWSLAASLPILGVSAWMLAGSLRAFLRKQTTVNPHEVGKAESLVVDGPNRFTRNPMYVGMTGMLLAHTVARRHVSSLLPTFAFWWLIDRCQIPAEESALEDRFGHEYRDYQRRVPRWLCRRPPHDHGSMGACSPPFS